MRSALTTRHTATQGFALVAPLLFACAEPPSTAPFETAPSGLPSVATVTQDHDSGPITIPSLAVYTTGCEAVLGEMPPLSCDVLPAVPQMATTDTGVVELVASSDAVADGSCDRPSLLSGCVPGSRAGWIENAQGSRFYLLCRVNRSTTADGMFDDIALIGQDHETGSTCMWGAPEDGAVRLGALLPKPGSEADQGFWADVPTLGAIKCRSCHDGNGIVVTPWMRENLPVDVNPQAQIHLVWEDQLATFDDSWRGMREWVAPEAAACTGCHALQEGVACFLGPQATGRLGNELLSPALQQFPTDRWMDDFDTEAMRQHYGDDAGWDATFGAATERLLACCGGLREGCWSEF